MAKQAKEISSKNKHFIEQQQIFFVATAVAQGRVNISPKGTDSLRVLNANKVIWLNLTGSGNETAAHICNNARMTIMFCAFDGAPNILRLYGEAKVVHVGEAGWDELFAHFEPLPGARQIFEVDVDLVQNSCGMAVPLYEYQGQRRELINWAVKKGEAGVRKYWSEKNKLSIDGFPTPFFTLFNDDSNR